MNRASVIAAVWAASLILSCAATWHVATQYTESSWHEREAKINADAARKVLAAGERVIAIERQHTQNLVNISADYQTELQRNADTKNLAITYWRSRANKLSIPVICPSGGNASDSAAASTAGRNGETRAELSDTAAEFLINLTNEADAVVLQLTACQQIVTSDRLTR